MEIRIINYEVKNAIDSLKTQGIFFIVMSGLKQYFYLGGGVGKRSSSALLIMNQFGYFGGEKPPITYRRIKICQVVLSKAGTFVYVHVLFRVIL